MFYLIFICLFFHNIVAQQELNTNHTITVYVHETFLIRNVLQYLPGKSFFHTPQGLSLARDLPKHYHFYKIAQGCIELNNALYSWDKFYIFGWPSEYIFDSVRKKAAEDLVRALQDVVEDYYIQYGVQPKVRLLGYSHGGNVVLHAANYLPLWVGKNKIDVEAWIFGTPVQQVNCHYVNNDNFTKIYSFFSRNDWIQKLDPQGLHNFKIIRNNFWSDRMFDNNARCIQIDLTVNGEPIGHLYYRSIFKYFPLIQQLVEERSQELSSAILAIDFKI